MKELLIVRSGNRYLRFFPEGPQFCDMDKASVFRLDQAPHVRELMLEARKLGVTDIELRKLTIIEEPYQEAT